MAPTRERSSSPKPDQTNKKQRTETSSLDPALTSSKPAIHLPDPSPLAEQYENAPVYKHLSVGDLFQDSILQGVVKESKTYGVRHEESSLPGWGWEEKHTDIYKIRQTPDLTSLDTKHLPDETLAALPYLTKLKQSLYSSEFREFIREVTKCGPLSGIKEDASVAVYTEGSHLLLHDDSISTRVVSYILYLPHVPITGHESEQEKQEIDQLKTKQGFTMSDDGTFLKGWDPKWGGSLELFPVDHSSSSSSSSTDSTTPSLLPTTAGPPSPKSTHSIPAQFGNLIFFQVQPGKSYHSVEEVIHPKGMRLGVSGWFHRPVEGEEGYEALDGEEVKKGMSSLAQITAAPTIPSTPYPSDIDPPTGLTTRHLKFLSSYLSPSYLNPTTLDRLNLTFNENSEIIMHNFMKPEIAEKVKEECRKVDKGDYEGLEGLIGVQGLGESEEWKIMGPSSKHRYLALDKTIPTTTNHPTPTLHSILTELYPSQAFRAWLQVVSSLILLSYKHESRRFRKGLDYTLAAGEEKDGEVKLDVVYGATWWAKEGEDEGEEEDNDVGGWECYLAAPEANSDPAVYQSGKPAPTKSQDTDANEEKTSSPSGPVESNVTESAVTAPNPTSSSSEDGPKITMGGVELEFDQSQLSDGDFDTDSEAEDEDGPLLVLPASFNRLLLVLRDPGVMKFVKYLSNKAEGSRWDVTGEFEVGELAEDDE